MTREINSNFAPCPSILDQFHTDVVREVREAVAQNDVVVVGMAWNGAVRKAIQALKKKDRVHLSGIWRLFQQMERAPCH